MPHSVKPLRLRAEDSEDLQIVSAAAQDAIFVVKDADWRPKARRFAVTVQRFRWEAGTKTAERVHAVLAFEGVLAVKAHKVAQARREAYASVLRISFTPGAEAPSGTITLDLAGDGTIALDVECIDVTLIDLAAPRAAVAKPDHQL